MGNEGLVAYMLLVTDVGKERAIASELKKMPGVTESRVVYGDYDVIVRLEVGDIKILDEIVSSIRKIPGIVRTSTLISPQ
ncbi:MAG: Lrp/AsnC family transcriptional regulator [Candidatus Methanomethylicota archaeon]|uniref:Lrp/AsnC family transcriptional regulator n=1 Tax=Thermoproteota archaeon TaxID=2056631 RepID=A0A497EU68_9CREN|nr:MAG: Lrp/AsnC family transcriptional regulator [Candidatus Verstraetearchaeota archaeon]RLE53424.1 MAG: Lrp/AsnC family transcriptional regulator [Candidatus Verstraetearchaeota archaeon]